MGEGVFDPFDEFEDDGETMLEAYPTSIDDSELDEFICFKQCLICKG